jgi:hypothetical protein
VINLEALLNPDEADEKGRAAVVLVVAVLLTWHALYLLKP